MKNYIELLKDIERNGTLKPSRAGNTASVFGRQLRWNMQDGFPLMTLKKVSFHNIAHELLWFLGAFDEEWKRFGNTNIRYLVDHNVNIWNDDAYRGYVQWVEKEYSHRPMELFSKEDFIEKIKEDEFFAERWGELGDSYGAQWRRWGERGNEFSGKGYVQGIDQIQQVIDNLKSNPLSRRHIVTAWNPSVVDSLTLPPCHYGFTLNVQPISERERMVLLTEDLQERPREGTRVLEKLDSGEWTLDFLEVEKYRLSLKWNQRSVDTPLGLPYNIASYGLLLHIIAHFTNMVPNDLVCSLEDVHYYTNQQKAVDEMISRENDLPPLPTLELIDMDDVETIDDIRIGNLKINDYHPLSSVKAPLSVGL